MSSSDGPSRRWSGFRASRFSPVAGRPGAPRFISRPPVRGLSAIPSCSVRQTPRQLHRRPLAGREIVERRTRDRAAARRGEPASTVAMVASTGSTTSADVLADEPEESVVPDLADLRGPGDRRRCRRGVSVCGTRTRATPLRPRRAGGFR